jgi:shikimate dehydrogenase
MSRLVERKILLGLIGSGITNSLSPMMHEVEASCHGIRLHYQLIDLDRPEVGGVATLPELLDATMKIGFNGLNMTFPCKQLVIPLLDELSEEAHQVGAVNTVLFRDGKKIGLNTDGFGWGWAFRRAMPSSNLTRVVLLGAGGAGAAIAHEVLSMGAKRLVVVDTDGNRAQRLVENLNGIYGGRAEAIIDVATALVNASGLIHATPTGMTNLPGTPLPIELLRRDLWVAEVVYVPIETELLKAAHALGCTTLDGGGMAVGQAARAFELFTGIAPKAARMERHFRNLVALRASGV